MIFGPLSYAGHGLAEVVGICVTLLILILVARVVIQWMTVDHRHPLVVLICAIADPILAPFRRLVPTFGGLDISPLVAIVVVECIGNALVTLLSTGLVDPIQQLILLAGSLLQAIDGVICVVLIVRILVTLFQADPQHPATVLTHRLAAPFVAPFRFVRSRVRGPDTAAVVALLAYLCLYVVIGLVFDVLAGPLGR